MDMFTIVRENLKGDVIVTLDSFDSLKDCYSQLIDYNSLLVKHGLNYVCRIVIS